MKRILYIIASIGITFFILSTFVPDVLETAIIVGMSKKKLEQSYFEKNRQEREINEIIKKYHPLY